MGKEFKISMKMANRLGLGMFAALFLSSCAPLPGLGKLEDAGLAVYANKNTSSNFSTGLDAFMSLVAPIIQQSKCMNCHTSQTPAISSSIPETAYTAALTRLNLASPASSTLVTKSQDGHCSNCGSSPRSVWVAAVVQWAAVENSGTTTNPTNPSNPNPPIVVVPPSDVGAPPVYLTATQMISGTGGNNRSISLAGRGVDFAGVNFLYDLQDPYAAVANSARIFNPRIQNNTAKFILVRGVRIFQSADATINPLDAADYKADVGSAYIDVDMVLYPNSTTRISVSEALMSKADGLYYAFGFQALEVTTSAACKSIASFNAVNAVYSGKCIGCHTNGGPGTGVWSFAAATADRCLQSLQRSDTVTPSASKIIQYPFNRANNHPSTAMNQADYDAMVLWITNER